MTRLRPFPDPDSNPSLGPNPNPYPNPYPNSHSNSKPAPEPAQTPVPQPAPKLASKAAPKPAPKLKPLYGTIPKEELERRYEANRALAQTLIDMRLQAVSEQEQKEINAFRDKSRQDQVEFHLSQWGQCIRYRRMARRITAQTLSEQVGVSLSTIRRMERGDLAVAASTYLMAVASRSRSLVVEAVVMLR